jgi:hypothetical protein
MLVSCLTHISILKMETIFLSELLVYFYWAIRYHIPEAGTLQYDNYLKHIQHISICLFLSIQYQHVEFFDLRFRGPLKPL